MKKIHTSIAHKLEPRAREPSTRRRGWACYRPPDKSPLDAQGREIACAEPGQDAALQSGFAWPVPRFIVQAGLGLGFVFR